jgi:hypothetical protein
VDQGGRRQVLRVPYVASTPDSDFSQNFFKPTPIRHLLISKILRGEKFEPETFFQVTTIALTWVRVYATMSQKKGG